MKEIKLIKTHIHAGVTYSPGDKLQVSDADAAFLIQQQVGLIIGCSEFQSSVETKNATAVPLEYTAPEDSVMPSDNHIQFEDKGENE
ncbi:DUF7210 family protein [[Haemophilus] ducreyi]|uniref:DUF7210 family protein n=1 Tax=Haemophilus ducreyi TaxID=730 RepID=UPI0006557E27|nr:hypothetical protein [[Haemophilus] ducreyi]AKO45682.1 hypothetical protein RZ66_05510 [[Haemophilus] ducreyi]AKO47068.1 hypothetical protein RZ67_05435 [[Haemophilus] ducreyi]AKO48413.1 hypothetical protein RZ68_05420 [[Haemophilus] ducreyi]AKO49798.1 hypothetical protein RZ69_05445 [[Haemophilus] ducreyi]ANF62120.1 hypothetical protein A6037_05025 [[Haemophilus] ducreyi]